MNNTTREFLKASSFDSTLNGAFDKLLEQVRALDIPESEQVMLDFFKHNLDQILMEAGEVIASQFTEDELKQLTEFYKTPLGQMMTSKMPAVGAQINMLMYAWIQRAQEHLEDKLFEKEINKH